MYEVHRIYTQRLKVRARSVCVFISSWMWCENQYIFSMFYLYIITRLTIKSPGISMRIDESSTLAYCAYLWQYQCQNGRIYVFFGRIRVNSSFFFLSLSPSRRKYIIISFSIEYHNLCSLFLPRSFQLSVCFSLCRFYRTTLKCVRILHRRHLITPIILMIRHQSLCVCTSFAIIYRCVINK